MSMHPFIAFGLILAAAIAGAYPAMHNMVALWWGTDTYMHGMFILPLSWYLLNKMPAPDYRPLPAKNSTLAALVCLWGMAYCASILSMINLAQQVVVISLLPILFFSIYGWRYLWHYRPPFLLAFLCVPVGDFLIPHLQTLTADVSVMMLSLSGVAVVHNGWYISIAAADFRVAEACSGVNFLISTFAVSCFYAFMFMTQWYKRAFFILLGLVVPVLANCLRVYLIIMLAEWGGVEAATGADHLVYGWIFFTIVMGLLFLIGSRLQDPCETPRVGTIPGGWSAPALKQYVMVAGFFLLVIFLSVFTKGQVTPAQYDFLTKGTATPAFSSLGPRFPHADTQDFWMAIDGWQAHRFAYQSEGENKKLISYDNHLFNKDRWSVFKEKVMQVRDIPVRNVVLIDANGQKASLIVTYCINHQYAARSLKVKWLQLTNRMLAKKDGGVALLFFKQGDHNVTASDVPSLSRGCLTD